jgi:hypothetical protein
MKILNTLVLAGFCSLPFQIQASSPTMDSQLALTPEQDIQPVCITPNQGLTTDSVAQYIPSSITLPIKRTSLVTLNDQTAIEFKFAIVNEDQYQEWDNQCGEEAELWAFIPNTHEFIGFNYQATSSENIFSKNQLSCSLKDGCLNLLRVFDLLNQLASQTYDLDVRNFLINRAQNYSLNIATEANSLGTHIDHTQQRITIDLRNLDSTYFSDASQTQVAFTLPRLITHEVIHAAIGGCNSDHAESKVIERTNQLLSALGFVNEPRLSIEQQYQHNDQCLSFIQAAPPPPPGEAFYRFFNRPTKEFVSDPWMWITAIFSAPSPYSALGFSRGVVRVARPGPVYRPLSTPARTTVTRTSRTRPSSTLVPASTSTVGETASAADTTSVIETASQDSQDSLSDSTLNSGAESLSDEPIAAADNDVFEDDTLPLTYKEQEEFAIKVDESISHLSEKQMDEKIRMEKRLCPTAHYINQAPEIARQFLRGDITVVELYDQCVPG